jgi:hypothetical protein
MRNKVVLIIIRRLNSWFLLDLNTLRNIHAIYFNFLSFYKVRNKAYNLVYNS